MNEKDTLKKIIYAFCKADNLQLFNFTSGHLGALPIRDNELVSLTESSTVNTIVLLVLEVLKFTLISVMPIKSIGLILRSTLRRFHSKKCKSNHALSILSLGRQSCEHDPYFGILLQSLNERFNYLKIVGGLHVKSEGYEFIESALSYLGLMKLAISILLSPLFVTYYLINSALTLTENRMFIVFTILGLREFNSGIFNNNKIIVTSIQSHLSYGKTKKVLYPMEGRNWEKIIIDTMNEYSIYSIGYLHCALTPKHFSLIFAGFYTRQSTPSVMIAPSEMGVKFLKQTFPKAVVRCGFFLRGSKNAGLSVKQDFSTALIALTGNIKESSAILNCLYKSELQKVCKVIIRLNPNTSSCDHLKALTEEFKFSLYTGQEGFLPSVCFFRSSSVALDYLRVGVLPVYVRLDEVVSNNVFELDNKYQFKSLDIAREKNINNDLAQSVKGILTDNINNTLKGIEMSDYYLNQSYNLSDLDQLLN